MEDPLNDLLSKVQVTQQQLKKEPILDFYFEFKENENYQPVFLRILLNSINIYNYEYDKKEQQSPSFPISIQKIKDEKGNLSLIMHTKSNENILNEVITNGIELFNDCDENTKKKIDINFEIDYKNQKKSKEEIHRNYIDGLLYENNCIKKFLSYFDLKVITILPNIIFFIKKNYVEGISKRLKLDCQDLLDQIKNPTNRSFPSFGGYSELDLLFILNESKSIKEMKNDFTLVKYFQQNIPIKDDNLFLEKDNIFCLEIKTNSADITSIQIEKTYNKAGLVRDSLYNQGFITNKPEIKVINIANFSKSKIERFKPNIEMKKIDTFLFFGDISINHTNLFSINKKIEFLEASNKNIQNENITLKTEIENVKNDNAALKAEIEKVNNDYQNVKNDNAALKAGIEILRNENVALKTEIENIKKSINQFLKSEKKKWIIRK